MADQREVSQVTQLLNQWQSGREDALNQLIPHVYKECRKLAQSMMQGEARRNHTLQATALVHEAFLRMAGQSKMNWQGRAHFMNMLAMFMRRTLIDYARNKKTEKRGSQFTLVAIEEVEDLKKERSFDLLALDQALTKLAKFDERKVKLVEMKYFAGMNIREISEVLGISPATVKREWTMAKAWLMNAMGSLES